MANTVLQERKKNNKNHHIFKLKVWKHSVFEYFVKNVNLQFLNHTTLLYIQIDSEGKGENIKIPESKNITCRNGAYIPNTQPFSLSSEGKNKWEIRAASCTEENTLGRTKKDFKYFYFLLNIKTILPSANTFTRQVLNLTLILCLYKILRAVNYN